MCTPNRLCWNLDGSIACEKGCYSHKDSPVGSKDTMWCAM